MKTTVLLLSMILLFGTTLVSQTKIWELPGVYKYLVEDGKGNVYVARTFGDPDSLNTLKKVDPAGNVLWEVRLATSYFTLHYSGAGIYLCPFNWGSINQSTISYYDTLGVLQWVYALPVTGISYGGHGQTDAGGNLVFAYDSAGSVRVLKLDTSGRMILNVLIPPVSLPTLDSHSMVGPVVNSNGDIWVMPIGESGRGVNIGRVSLDQVRAATDAVLVDGRNGSVITRTSIHDNYVAIHKQDIRGNGSEFDADGPPFVAAASSGRNLVAYGQWHYNKTQIRKFQQVKMDDISSWQMALVDPYGNVNRFSYRGKGKMIFRDRLFKYSGDQGSNSMITVQSGAAGEIFFIGTAAVGKSTNSNVNLEQSLVVGQLDAGFRKIVWKYTLPASAYNEAYFSHANQIFLAGNLVNACGQSLTTFNAGGAIGSSPLNFSNCIALPVYDGSVNFEGPVSEPHVLYLLAGGKLAKFDLQGVLAQSHFTERPSATTGEEPSSFMLYQNYPNPFNPSTTIRFDLKQDAIVSVDVFDLLGQKIATLADDETMTEGPNELEFDGSSFGSGIYFYRISVKSEESRQLLFSAMRHMLLLK